MFDCYLHDTVERISPEPPVPIVCISHDESRLRGSANVAFNLVSLGAHSSLVSLVRKLTCQVDISKIEFSA